MMKIKPEKVAVIGGGASGCLAAIAAAQAESTVFLFEKNEKPGKKLYATGNGRCNLTNFHLDRGCYHSVDQNSSACRVMEMIGRFSREDLIRFFGGIGVPVHDRDGYVYPRTDQAETVVRALEKCMRKLDIQVCCETRIVKIESLSGQSEGKRFRVYYETRSAHAAVLSSDSSVATYSRKKGKKQKTRRGKNSPLNSTDAVKTKFDDFDSVILCTGGLAGPAFGSTGDGYRLAETFSHHTTPLYPALTQLICDSPWLKRAAGARCHVSVCLIRGSAINFRHSPEDGEVLANSCGNRESFEISSKDGKVLANSRENGGILASPPEDGELQMTDYGISGIPVFQLSGRAAEMLDNGERVTARINFLPEFTDAQFEKELSARLREDRNQILSDLLLGLANRKIIDFLLASEGLQAEMKARRLPDDELAGLIRKLRSFDLPVSGVRSYENAQVTAGGIPLREITDRFESVFCPGLYIAGELLDVDGRCGGYNLQWAMTSGFLAGTAAAAPH